MIPDSPEKQPLPMAVTQPSLGNNSPGARPRWHWLGLWAATMAYIVIFWANYPPIAGIEDEVGFINQALVFSKGSISSEGAGYHQPLFDFIEARGRHVSWRNPGRSLMLVPFLELGGYHAIFASGALIHVLLALVAGLILARMGRSPLWAILVLCHPTLALYSRTIMGDAGAALGLLLALYAIVACRKPGLWAGLAIGGAAVMRYQAGLALPFVAAAMAFTLPIARPKFEGLKCLLSGGAIGLLIVLFNLYVFGNFVGRTSQGYFSAEFIGPHLLFYGGALLALWPLMLLAPAWDRSPQRFVVWALTLPIIALFIPYYYLDTRPTWIETLIVGQRLIQPVLPVWIVCYAWVIGERLASWGKLPRWRLAIGLLGTAGLLAMVGKIFHAHQHHLNELVAVRNVITAKVENGSLLACNETAEKLFGVPQPDASYRLVLLDPKTCLQNPNLELEGQHFFLALLPHDSKSEFDNIIKPLQKHYGLEEISTTIDGLRLFKSP